MKLKYSDDLEKAISGLFGAIGIAAIIIKLFLTGASGANVLDAVKDVAGLAITIAVFLVASKIFKNMKFKDFTDVFERHLAEWAEQNRYLIDIKSVEQGKGKFGKRSYSMLIDHSNLVTAQQTAAETSKLKGAFVYLPLRNEMDDPRQEIFFRLNQSTFKRQQHYSDVIDIAVQFAKRINMEFSESLGVQAQVDSQDKFKVSVSLEGVEHTEENAKRLVDMVEFVKTMVLALA